MEILHLVSVLLGFTSIAFCQDFNLNVSPLISEVNVGEKVELLCSVMMGWRDLTQVGVPTWLRLEPGQQGSSSYEIISVQDKLQSKYQGGRWTATGGNADHGATAMATATLIIDSAQKSDDGKYTCKLTSGGIIATTTPVPAIIEIIVRQPLATLELTIGGKVFTPDSSTLELDMPPMGTPGITCLAGGSYPSSKIKILIDGSDFTNSFTKNTKTNYVANGSDKFDQYRTVDIKYTVDNFNIINAAKSIECKGTDNVSGQSMIVNVQLLRKLPHEVECDNTTAISGDHRAILRCTITSDPVVQDYSWRIGTTGDVIPMGNKTNLYESVELENGAGANTVVAQLQIFEVAPEDFTETFILEYETNEGAQTYEVRLTEKFISGAVRYVPGIAVSMAFMILIHFMW